MTLKMMMKYGLASGTAMTLMIATLPAMAYTGQESSKQAKVSITEARAIALKAHPGKKKVGLACAIRSTLSAAG
jgi:hypothetical protein